MERTVVERRFGNIIGNLLRTGVLCATLLVLAGGLWHVIVEGAQPFVHSIFQGEPLQYRTIGGIVSGILAGNGTGLIQVGLLLLLATPVARVLLSLIGFAVQSDRMYVVFTAIVLLTLGFSLFAS